IGGMDAVAVLFMDQPVEQLPRYCARVSSWVGCYHEDLLGIVCEAVVEESARARKYPRQVQRCLDHSCLVLRIYPDNILVNNPLSPLTQFSQERKYLGLLHRSLRCYRLGDIFGLGCDAVLLGESLSYALESWKFSLQEFEPLRLHLRWRLCVVPEASQSLAVDLFPTHIRALPLDYF